uniref:PH domain-containing protein n=1 Tax=Onchocerca volvulus TaxID=6282 RepID=A0A8R1TWX3_ONCVO
MNGVDVNDHPKQRQRRSHASTTRATAATTTTTTTTTTTAATTAPVIKIHGSPKDSNCDEKRGILRSLSFQFSTSLNRGRRRLANVFDDSDEVEQQGAFSTRGYKSNRLELAMYSSTFGVQHYGIMLKQSKRKNRTAKWNKRFFILKECFLVYYKVSEKKMFEKTRRMNLHPKGIVPLVGCSVVAGQDHGHKNCLLITHTQFKSAVIVCAPDSKAQESWLTALRDATKISYKNTTSWEKLVEELESRGVLLSEEKKMYEEKLLAEAQARQEEHCRYLCLERAKDELEKERERLIRMTKKLKDDLQSVKNELKITNETKRTLEQEKISLNAKTEHLVSNMQSLNLEKSKIEEQVSSIIREREKFLLENQNLSTVTCQLKNRLMEIETKTNCILAEKERVEAMLRLNEKKTVDLEKEREYYNSQTMELLNSLKEVSEQRDITEAELKDEVMARMGAEKQLQAAEKALEHLETALKLTGAQMSELQEHIMPDVHKLREFFEQCAEISKMDANRPLIMRNAIHARRSLRRSKTRIRGSFRRKLATAFTMQSISTTGYNLATSPTEMSNPEEPIPKIEPNSLMHL